MNRLRNASIKQLSAMTRDQVLLLLCGQVVMVDGRPLMLDITHRAKLYAKAHGYKGSPGGWIKDTMYPKTSAMYHGWVSFYSHNAYCINEWIFLSAFPGQEVDAADIYNASRKAKANLVYKHYS